MTLSFHFFRIIINGFSFLVYMVAECTVLWGTTRLFPDWYNFTFPSAMFECSLVSDRKCFYLTKYQNPIPFSHFLLVPKSNNNRRNPCPPWVARPVFLPPLDTPHPPTLWVCSLLSCFPSSGDLPSSLSVSAPIPLYLVLIISANPPRCHAQQVQECSALPPPLMTQCLAGRAKPAATKLHASIGPLLFTAPPTPDTTLSPFLCC